MVDSKVKAGTTFTLMFPTVATDPVPASRTETVARGGTETILLVDDEPPLVKVVQKILERLGYHVVEKTDSREALAAFQAEPGKYDGVITDYSMANMTGVELAEAIKAVRPGMPVILCTGYSEMVAECKFQNDVIDAVIGKPIVKDELCRVLRQALDAGGKEKNQKARILVIDDDDQFRPMLRRRLERAGYEVTEAANGREGVKRFQSAPTDLIITDLIMPEQEGLETICEITKSYPDTKIIAISGGGTRGAGDYLPIAKSLGALRTYEKPLEWGALLEGVKELLS